MLKYYVYWYLASRLSKAWAIGLLTAWRVLTT